MEGQLFDLSPGFDKTLGDHSFRAAGLTSTSGLPTIQTEPRSVYTAPSRGTYYIRDEKIRGLEICLLNDSAVAINNC